MSLTAHRQRQDRAAAEEAVTLRFDVGEFYRREWWTSVADRRLPIMPIREKLMNSLVQRYGRKRGEQVYHAMEGEGKGPFGPGGKYHADHVAFAKKHDLPERTGKKKPRSR